MKYIAKGAFHLHTTYSDGTGTIPEIATDAKKAGLDWIVITDHNSLKGLHNGEEGWYDGVAVIIGQEISPKMSDHYLALDIEEEISSDLPPSEFIHTVKKLGGIGFVAHPDESTIRKNKFPPLRWTDWNLNGFDGIEIWNYMSDWGDNYNERLNIYNLFIRHTVLKGPTPNVLKWWDELNNKNNHILSAVGSLDSHAFNYGIIKIFPYYDTFKTITNYLMLREKLSSDFTEAKKQVLGALKSGKNIIINRVWSNSSDSINFNILNRKHCAFPGEKINSDDKTKIVIELPQKAKIRLIKDGEIIAQEEAKEFEHKAVSSGKYRFEAYFKNRPWIFSNPIISE